MAGTARVGAGGARTARQDVRDALVAAALAAARRVAPGALQQVAPYLTPSQAQQVAAVLPDAAAAGAPGDVLRARAALLAAWPADHVAAAAAALWRQLRPVGTACPDLLPWDALAAVLPWLPAPDLLGAADMLPAWANTRRVPPPPTAWGVAPAPALLPALHAVLTALAQHGWPDRVALLPFLVRDPRDAAVAGGIAAGLLGDPWTLLEGMQRALGAFPAAVCLLLAQAALTAPHRVAEGAQRAWQRWWSMMDTPMPPAAAAGVWPAVLRALTAVDPQQAATALSLVATRLAHAPHPAPVLRAALLVRSLALLPRSLRDPALPPAWVDRLPDPAAGGASTPPAWALRIAAAVVVGAPPPSPPDDPDLTVRLGLVWRRLALPGDPVWPGLGTALLTALRRLPPAPLTDRALGALLTAAPDDAPEWDALLTTLLTRPIADDALLLAALAHPLPDTLRAALQRRLITPTAHARALVHAAVAAARTGGVPRRPPPPPPPPAPVVLRRMQGVVRRVTPTDPAGWEVLLPDGRVVHLPTPPVQYAGAPPRAGIILTWTAAEDADGAPVGVRDVGWSDAAGMTVMRPPDPGETPDAPLTAPPAPWHAPAPHLPPANPPPPPPA